ncbi:hypothetical protein BDN72DRAFT_674435 [Pluteus cervinus]|uniref:Uncharacterized protein n=1 Tax=Pluteus cervinus TaxID=181527 RepID=A0ACD3AUA5_9AGAR|nr:hypothetical protein BDN72DRAFT_674435 [Pluteus cervinus]
MVPSSLWARRHFSSALMWRLAHPFNTQRGRRLSSSVLMVSDIRHASLAMISITCTSSSVLLDLLHSYQKRSFRTARISSCPTINGAGSPNERRLSDWCRGLSGRLSNHKWNLQEINLMSTNPESSIFLGVGRDTEMKYLYQAGHCQPCISRSKT